MLRAVGFTVAVAVAAIVSLPSAGRASLYQPDDTRMSIPVGANGVAQALPFDEFQRRLLVLLNQSNAELKDPAGNRVPNKDRDDLLKRIAERQAAPNRSPEDTVALATLQIRVSRVDEAEALLARQRQGFLSNATLAHVYALKGDWERALEYLSIANGEEPPAGLQGLSPAQLEWQQKLNRTALTRLFKLRLQESLKRPKPPVSAEDVDDLFRVRFVNEAEKYEPGNLAAAERAKLPPDAIATVQQLLFWFPHDTRLYWLLAELYAANKEFEPAGFIMNVCADPKGRQYSNRRTLAAHWAAIRPLFEEAKQKRLAAEKADEDARAKADADAKAAEEAPAEGQNPQENTQPVPISLGTIWIYFGVVGLIAVLAIVRIFLRRGTSR